jgi:NADPH2:quinone reductase
MAFQIQIHELGGPEVLRYEPVDLPPPGPGQVLLRQTAVGLNFIDTYHRSGLYPLPQLPHGLGVEAAGVIAAVGEGTEPWAVGDRVAYAGGPPGAYASERLVSADRLVAVPAAVADRQAAALMIKGMTAEYLIHRCFAVRPGMTVLLHAAAGGTGLIVCQWLKHLGATVIGTVGSAEKAALAREHGCDHPIVYTEEDFVARVRDLTSGAGVPVVYDAVGQSTAARSLDCLARRGLLVCFGNASGPAPPADPLELLRKGSLYLTRPTLFDYTATRDELEQSAHAVFEAVAQGAIKVPIFQEWPLGEAGDAHRALEGRQTSGCSVLLP